MQHRFQDSPAGVVRVEVLRPRLRCAALLGGAVATAVMTAACSVSFPLGAVGTPVSNEVTASIRPVPGKITDEEDRRRAKAALATALDPQGDGQTVRWENPTTGSKGSFTAVGHAYPTDGRVCRAFLQAMHQDGSDRTAQGTACTVTAGEWAVTEAKPFRKS